MSPDRLFYMANQIGKFFQSQGHDKAVPGIAEHIRKFWDPRMRAEIFRHIDESGGTGLDANVLEALTQLKIAEEGMRKTRGEAEKVDTGQQRAGEAPPEVTKNGLG